MVVLSAPTPVELSTYWERCAHLFHFKCTRGLRANPIRICSYFKIYFRIIYSEKDEHTVFSDSIIQLVKRWIGVPKDASSNLAVFLLTL